MHRIALADLALASALLCAACSRPAKELSPVARHSSSIAVSADGGRVYVVNPDADSVSVIDPRTRTLVREIALGAGAPQVDASGRFTPVVAPRALALAPRAGLLYVTGERSGKLYAVDLASASVAAAVDVGSEPVGVLVAPDESAVFVACSQDALVARIDVGGAAPSATVATQAKPWSLGWSDDGSRLFVSHLLAPTITGIDPDTLGIASSATIPDVPSRGDKRLAYGQARALYGVAVRPGGSGEIWVAHTMLATATAQPALDFESTAFPAVSVLASDGSFAGRMSSNSMGVPGVNGQFGDIVSGPHDFDFTPDGRYALVVDSASEDVMAIDASARVESKLLRPLPGHLQEGIVVAPDGKTAYVDERNSADVAVIAIDTSGATIGLSVDGAPIARISHDPMPAAMRRGQFLFFTANSDVVPITKNHWLACASCHPEGRSDAVTWRFEQGPRDTPSNAGGVADTGFLHHTADRRAITDYFHTINTEQGGKFTQDDPLLEADLEDLQKFVNFGLPAPVPPHTDPGLVAKGKAIFERATVGCSGCHSGPAHTDSGAGNPTLDLAGPILLHDVGTCNTGTFPDQPHKDVADHPRAACAFDTPTLRGVSDSAPYLHDGSAATLHDVLAKTRGKMGNIDGLSPADLDALVEYLRSL